MPALSLPEGLSPASRRAIEKYGLDTCQQAALLGRQGWGSSSISLQSPVGLICKTTRQVDAAIRAADELSTLQAGELPPVTRVVTWDQLTPGDVILG